MVEPAQTNRNLAPEAHAEKGLCELPLEVIEEDLVYPRRHAEL